ncbi:MAG TPA: RNA polymerase sigma factor [Bryobacteraceae bacterium]|nr:RNA polymerase sigma factor [Bryobacteraceae bacterium]
MTPQKAFDQYHEAVYRFAYRLTGRPDLAEDITQECFLVLVRSPQRYDPARAGMKTFLFAIARNLALKEHRDYGGEQALDDADIPAATVPRESLEVSSAVAAAVAALPQLQREALILFEYEGVTIEEIAEIVAANVGTVKSRLHRARERLRRALAPYRNVGNTHGTV